MSTKGYLLSTTNLQLPAAQWVIPGATNAKQTTMEGFAFGDLNGDGTGEIGLKVMLIGSSISGMATIVQGNLPQGSSFTPGSNLLMIGAETVQRSTLGPGSSAGLSSVLFIDKDTGGLLVEQIKGPAVAAITNVAAANASTAILTANPARRGGTIKNNASTVMHLCFGTTGSVANSAYDLPPYSATLGITVEIPFNYAGAISAFWEGAPTGNANVTEITQ